MRNNDFQDVLGEDYALLRYAYPHHDEFQQAVADQIQHYINVNNFSSSQPVSIVEAGVGTGVSAHTILKTCNGNVRLVGVDNSQTMLTHATQILDQYTEQVTFVCEDLLQCLQDCADDSFDVFVAVWTLHNLPPTYREDVFNELKRVLKSGGLFVSGDKYAVADSAMHERQLQTQLNRFRSFSKNGGSETLVKSWVQHNLEDDTIRISEQEQCNMLEILGFSDVKTVYRTDMEAVIVGIKS